MNGDFDFVTSPLAGGLSVIEASAGTGKTYAISHLVPRLLLDGTSANLGEILLVTFTNDAARELSERVRRVLEKLAAPPDPNEEAKDNGLHRLREKFGAENVRAVAGRALLDLDLLGVSTIHSFCQKTLQTEGTLCGLSVVPELIPDAGDIVEQALYDIWEKRIASDPLLTMLAVAGGWKPGSDLAFIKYALASPRAEFIPNPRRFGEVVAELRDAPARFTAAVCDELRELWKNVPSWNQSAMDEAGREGLLKGLTEAVHIEEPDFLEAVRQLADSAQWITARTNDAKALRAAAAECEGVRAAADICRTIDLTSWHFRIDCLDEIRAAVSRALASNRQITYDGLIGSLFDALRGEKAGPLADRLRARYKVALIDESQDTDDRQFEIFKKIFVGFDGEARLSAHRLVLIGDPKQAIYAFRGADVNTYLGAKALAGKQLFSLTKTFRSPGPLVCATNALFSRPGSLLKAGLSFQKASSGLEGDRQLYVENSPEEARMEFWIVPDGDAKDYATSDKRTSSIACIVASEIVRLLSARATIVHTKPDGSRSAHEVGPSDFAVLVSDGFQAAAVAEALFARSVPAIRAGADDIMASDEAADLLALLRALHEPRRSALRLAALATRWLGLDSEEVRSADEDGEAWIEKLSAWQADWLREGIAAALATIDREERITARLASLDRGERRVTNFRQLTDLLEAASLELGNHPGRLVRWLAQEIARCGEGRAVEERLQQLESDAEAVQIVTMHSAKGLQYPLVFCPFLWSSKEPKGFEKLSIPGEAPKIIDISLADDSDKAAVAKANLEDRLRLAYVAVTRAMAKVWIFGGEVCGTKTPASALDWLLRTDEPEDFSAWKALAHAAGRGVRHTAGVAALTATGHAGRVIACKEPPPPDGQRWQHDAEAGSGPLHALEAPPIPRPWGLTSFSALTREKNPHAAPDTAAPKGPKMEAAPNPFFDAPGGTLVGTAVHEWIEQWDFSPANPAALASHFSKFPIPESTPPFAGRVAGMLGELREAKLPGLGCRMHEACPSAGASEWHFQLPIQGALAADALAHRFAEHGHRDYAALLAALPAEQITGYLHGFLDRIAFHNGSWGVIDWKTNNLGSNGYGSESLMDCAVRSHYLLQTHLYLVALRRFLGPEEKIAGAWLVFLRGVSADTENGILHVQPPPALLAGLDSLFTSPSRE